MAGVGSAVRRLYLAVYNWIVFAGWCVLPSAALLALALFPVSWIRHGSLIGIRHCSRYCVARFLDQTRNPVDLTGISLDLGVSQGAGAVLRDFGAVGERP